MPFLTFKESPMRPWVQVLLYQKKSYSLRDLESPLTLTERVSS